MKKVFMTLCLMSGLVYAAEYSSNKRYSYEEISEILSEKILENKGRITALEQENLKLKNDFTKSNELLNQKVSELYKIIKQNENTKTKIPNTQQMEQTKPAKKNKQSVEFDKALYEKVK